ncbi:MAG TPA: hypothetical protein PKE04_14925, partial [Clostridia bacterium]|nr:hypothetical protein [Clostridia bacterium]
MNMTVLASVGEANRVLMIVNGKQFLGGSDATRQGKRNPTYILPIGPDGSQFYAYINSPVKKQNTFITSDNKHIPETLSFFDYFYSEEGVEAYFMGVKDVTYYLDEEGNPHYTDFVAKNPDGLLVEEVLGEYTPWSGGNNPTMAEGRSFGSNVLTPEERANCAFHVEKGVEAYWGEFSYSDEDYTALATYRADIGSYVAEMTAKFITGDASIEKDWDTYLATIERMDLSGMMAIYQRGLDSFYEITGVR